MSADELPHDIEAEEACLGAAMLSPDSAALLVEQLTSRHFYRPAHQVIFESVAELVNRSVPVEPLSVKVQLEKRAAGEVVDTRVLIEMIQSVTSAGHVGFYVDRLKDLLYRRDLILEGARLTRLGRRVDLDRDDVTEEARKVLDRVTGVDTPNTGKPLSELIYPFLDRLESKAVDAGVTTGWADLDHLLIKLRPGQLIVVGARPGMGKSVLMVNMALHVGLKLGQRVLFVSLEMSEDEILARIIAHQAKVTLHNLQAKTLDEDAWARVEKRAAEMASADHIVIDDDPGMTIASLRATLSKARRAGQLPAIVFVDYLQLMTSPRKSENRQQEVSEISRSLKLLAKDFDVPIVVGSQLNRGPEMRANKRPTKADLRESGSLEQDADVVILLHREDAYEPESPRAGEIDLIVDKHRQGATATITAAFQGHYARIADMEPEPVGSR
ncbi:replicative DNA helicase [Microtetraspora sp. AC03309]|uniref:replicative DNA helicase n=1 Tax=Microtetraspora sp. AC03309 TaxID=2779376 RepID=UPI001E4D0034|nr:replicative DNA helicase [Microtetraspora sp. AC03309]MCC5574532.1 replicative DNA helicase [Microtetraspora sp. AC03309]